MEMSQQENIRANNNRARQDEISKSNLRLFILPMLLVFCTLFYYFGELVDWAAWDVLRLKFFYGIHDVH